MARLWATFREDYGSPDEASWIEAARIRDCGRASPYGTYAAAHVAITFAECPPLTKKTGLYFTAEIEVQVDLPALSSFSLALGLS